MNQKIEAVRKTGNTRVVEVQKKHELMSSHTCRRSFCTNMYLSGFPTEEFIKIFGQKSRAAFMRYIKVDNQQAANWLKELRNNLQKRQQNVQIHYIFINTLSPMVINHQNFDQLIDNVYQTHCALQANAAKVINQNLTIRNWLLVVIL